MQRKESASVKFAFKEDVLHKDKTPQIFLRYAKNTRTPVWVKILLGCPEELVQVLPLWALEPLSDVLALGEMASTTRDSALPLGSLRDLPFGDSALGRMTLRM